MASTSSSKTNSIAGLLKEADDALYEVKERGRNQVLPKPIGPAVLAA